MKRIIFLLTGIGLLTIIGVVVINVIRRSFFASPFLAAIEIAGLAGFLLIPFAISLTECERAHIIVKILISRFTFKLQNIFSIFTLLLSLGTVGVLIWGGILQMWEDATSAGATTQVLHISRAPFRFIWVVGCIIFFGYLLRHFSEFFLKDKKK